MDQTPVRPRVKGAPVSRGLSPEDVRRWAARGIAYEAAAGQVLVYAGHRPWGLFAVLSGSLRLVREGADRRREAGSLSAPVLLGEFQRASGEPFPLTVECRTPCRVVFEAAPGPDGEVRRG